MTPSLLLLDFGGSKEEGRGGECSNMRRLIDAGWSSPVARRAHNPEVAGSNPVPATKFSLEGKICPVNTSSKCLPIA